MAKKTIVALLMLVACAIPIFADISDYYPITVDVVLVMTNQLGYVVVYRSGYGDLKEVYIPREWFAPGGKAILVSGTGPEYPLLVVYYKGEEFSHCKLFVPADIVHPDVIVLPMSPGLEEKFKVDTIDVTY